MHTFFQENYGLKELYVSMNGFGYDGAKHMGHALKHNQSLEVLDLSSNRIPSEGVLEIAKGLKVNENLTMLKVSGALKTESSHDTNLVGGCRWELA